LGATVFVVTLLPTVVCSDSVSLETPSYRLSIVMASTELFCSNLWP
jgi:hypothetical protein